MSTFGIDETQPAPVFVRIVNPTDIQKVSARISAIIKDYHGGIDILNPYLWSVLGLTTLEGPVVDFLSRLIGLQREYSYSLNETNAGAFILELVKRHNYSQEQIKDYVNAYLQCVREGVVPDSIVRSYEYHPSTLAEDAGAIVSSATKGIAPWIVGGVLVYALITVGIPQMVGGLFRGKKRHSKHPIYT